MAQPAASLASELRRLIPELREMVGDDCRVLVGFDRGGWSRALFADLDAAGLTPCQNARHRNETDPPRHSHRLQHNPWVQIGFVLESCGPGWGRRER